MRAPLARLPMLAALAVLTQSAPAAGFAEDVCHPKGGGAMVDCLPVPAACVPVPDASAACLASAVAEYGGMSLKYGVMRSSIHADVTHLLAQAAGFSADDAYWIAAYAEVPDYGVFEPTDMNGATVGGGALRTAVLDGFVRTDLATGGFLFHFVPVRAGAGPIDGLHPSLTDPATEGMLVHMRSWALAATGAGRPVCVGGLTVAAGAGDHATGATCYPDATVMGDIALFGPTSYPFSLDSGPQVIQDPKGGPQATYEAFDALVGGGPDRVADARLGIYLHVLADRISHHRCSDASDLTGPEPGAVVTIDMTGAECTQGPHVLRHVWETGVDFTQLADVDRTTEAGLAAVYDELVVFAQGRGVASASATDPAARAAVLDAASAALQKPGADVRVSALAAAACARGLSPLPGAPACPTPPDAGAGGGGGTSSSSGGSGGVVAAGGGGSGGAATSAGGGCLLSAAPASGWGGLLLGLGVLALARRRRR